MLFQNGQLKHGGLFWCKLWPTTMPILLPNRKTLLTFPGNPAKIHPLYPKPELLMCHLSGDPLKAKEFRQKLQGLSYSPGGLIMQANTKLTTKSGKCSAVNGTLIHFKWYKLSCRDFWLKVTEAVGANLRPFSFGGSVEPLRWSPQPWWNFI